MPPRILLVSTDRVGASMAGPGIRAWELARSLSRVGAVTLAVPDSSDMQTNDMRLITYGSDRPRALAEALTRADVVIGQGFVFESHPGLLTTDLPLAIDLYDPLILESLDLYANEDLATAQAQHTRYQALTEALLRRGDFFFCATETQRDYWLGALTATGRITPELARQADRDLRSLIDCVPSGLTEQPPEAITPVLRGVHPAIADDDFVLLWAGGLWDWFDPDVIVRAMAALHNEYPHLRLCFFAGPRPNPRGDPFRTRVYDRVRALAAELGILDTAVIFLDEWIAYNKRGAYLYEADVGVSAHRPGIETRFAFRTRLLDYLWARLPVVCTAGDSLGETIAQNGVGALVPAGDVEGWIAALRRMIDQPDLRADCRSAADALARRYIWSRVAEPLAAFCQHPRRTAPRKTAPAATERIAELERALEERLRYTRHVEAQYQAAIAQNRTFIGKFFSIAQRLLHARNQRPQNDASGDDRNKRAQGNQPQEGETS